MREIASIKGYNENTRRLLIYIRLKLLLPPHSKLKPSFQSAPWRLPYEKLTLTLQMVSPLSFSLPVWLLWKNKDSGFSFPSSPVSQQPNTFFSLDVFFWSVFFLLQALPNQQTVDYPSFKLVIVGDGGTGAPFVFFLSLSIK